MALLQVNFFSQVLRVACSMDVILPESTPAAGYDKTPQPEDRDAPPVLYLLHGLSDDQTIWQRRTSIERYVENRNLAVIMPAVGRSFYADEKSGFRYWTFISEELPDIAARLFRISGKLEDTYAAGLSMGGYGALKLGLLCEGRFAAVASLSGAVDASHLFREPEYQEDAARIYGSPEAFTGSDNDLFKLAGMKASAGSALPRIFLACGTADTLYDDNCRFRKHLVKLGIAHAWEEKEGADHEWGYWDESIRHVLDWIGR